MRKIENYFRINGAVNIGVLQNTQIFCVSSGCVYCLYECSAVSKFAVLNFQPLILKLWNICNK